MGYTVICGRKSNESGEDDGPQIIGTLGMYATSEKARAVCRDLVDEFLKTLARPGVAAAELYFSYIHGMDDPTIDPVPPDGPFDARSYARSRCEALGTGPVV